MNDYLKCASKTTFISQNVFNKNLAAIHEIKAFSVLNKPIYVGFTVLKLSKWFTYDFHYNYIKKKFDAEFLFTDTDSLIYEIKSKNINKDFFINSLLFDFSNFSKNSEFYDNQNEMVIRKFKDESGVKSIK